MSDQQRLSPLSLVRRGWRIGMHLLLPPRCVLCDAELDEEKLQTQLCQECAVNLTGTPTPACRRCGLSSQRSWVDSCSHCQRRRFAFGRVFRTGEYEGPLRDAVLQAKTLAGEPIAATLGDTLADAVQKQLAESKEFGGKPDYDFVTCVPAFWYRRLRRGTNSAAVIAQLVAERLRLPLALDLLVCRRNIEKQSQLSLNQRRKNVREAFRKSWGYNIQSARVLLVDDVMTSGATAQELARVLRRAGASQVDVAVVARASGPDW